MSSIVKGGCLHLRHLLEHNDKYKTKKNNLKENELCFSDKSPTF